MTEYIVKRWPGFDNFVSLFTQKLTRPAQRHLIAILIAFVIFDGRKNLAGLNRALFAPCHPSSLARFISEASWSAEEFEQIRHTYLNRQVRRFLDAHRAKGQKVNAFLCIDDTNNPKTGTHSPGTAYQYSHLAGGLIRCYCLVTAIVVIGPYVIPLSFQLYQPRPRSHQHSRMGSRQSQKENRGSKAIAITQPGPPTETKIDLALNLVRAWQPPEGTQPYVLADSWYVCEEMFEECARRGVTLIGGLRANRLVATPTCPKLTALSSYAPQLPKSAYQLVTLGKQRFRLAGVVATLKGGRQVKLMVNRSVSAGSNLRVGIKSYTYRFFVSSEPALSVTVLAEFYSVRWEIETFHAQAKQLLGLDHNQCWREANVRRMWTLLLMAFSYLMLEAVEHPQRYTQPDPSNEDEVEQGCGRIGLAKVVAHHKREAHRAHSEWVYAQAMAGQPLEQVLDAIGA